MANDTNYKKRFEKAFSDYIRMHTQSGVEADLIQITNKALLYALNMCGEEEEQDG